MVVHDSVVRILSPPTSLLSVEPLRGCCFAVDARSADDEDWFLFRTLLLLHVLGCSVCFSVHGLCPPPS